MSWQCIATLWCRYAFLVTEPLGMVTISENLSVCSELRILQWKAQSLYSQRQRICMIKIHSILAAILVTTDQWPLSEVVTVIFQWYHAYKNYLHCLNARKKCRHKNVFVGFETGMAQEKYYKNNHRLHFCKMDQDYLYCALLQDSSVHYR